MRRKRSRFLFFRQTKHRNKIDKINAQYTWGQGWPQKYLER